MQTSIGNKTMPSINPAVLQWIRQMGDDVVYFIAGVGCTADSVIDDWGRSYLAVVDCVAGFDAVAEEGVVAVPVIDGVNDYVVYFIA